MDVVNVSNEGERFLKNDQRRKSCYPRKKLIEWKCFEHFINKDIMNDECGVKAHWLLYNGQIEP